MSRLAWIQLYRDAVVVHRLEFPFSVNYLCYASWGACFAVDGAFRPPYAVLVLAAVANLLLIVAGLALNTAADVGTDEYHHERAHLAAAARRLGRGRVVRWAATEMILALLLAGALAVWSMRPVVVAAAAVIVVLQVLYNVEPVRLKRRGLTGVAAFCASVAVLPFLLSYWVVRPDLVAWAGPILAGLGCLAVGRMMVWSIPDRAVDAMTGMRTPSVRYGPSGTLTRSIVVTLAGVVLTCWGLWWRYGPGWALPPVALQAAFLGALPLPWHAGRDALRSSVRIRHWAMAPVLAGTLAITIIPLVAA
ncbi:MAG TPA: UbiA family prenyltransferase [Pseudonocardiaceae bacterium]|nr:UbiA family prenyltransferase [Pseudonocardiaceae bacterium]